jgi:sugar-specific transcriptional regulator TrmB
VIQPLLEQLGLGQKEILVYLAILQQGKISPADIASTTRINRTTVYAVAKELLKKNLIREEKGKTTYFLARPPHDLGILLEKDQEQLRRKEHLIQKAVAELEPLTRGLRYGIPTLSFIEEDRVEAYMKSEAAKWTESVIRTDGMWHGFQDHSFVEHYEGWVDWYWHQPFAQKIILQVHSNESGIEKRMASKKYERRQIRFWKGGEVGSTLWISGEYIVAIATRTRPHYLIEIHDKLLSATLRTMFAALWQAS